MNPTTTLAQRMAANDGYLHACCDPNPLPGFISTMNANAEDIINYRAIKVPGTDTPKILHVASTRLRMPGRFMEPTRPVTTTGPDAMGYIARPSEPRDAYIQQLEESICSHGFSITHPAMACPIIDPDDIKIAEMINENKLAELCTYCDSREYIERPASKFVVVDGGARWKICFPSADMYIKVLSVRTSVFERMYIARQVNMLNVPEPIADEDTEDTDDLPSLVD